MKVQAWQLRQRQGLDLHTKIKLSERRIKDWYDHYNGKVYIAFSGGKDSTVLLHLVRRLYPAVLGVFVDTGLEYPEIKKFVNTFDNIEIIRPKMPFNKVLEKYGYPVISKSVAMSISRYNKTKSPIQKKLRKYGGLNPNTGKMQKMGVIPKKWHFLLKAPFKINDWCCDVMKKQPIKRFEKKTGLKSFIGNMASDSYKRQEQYLKYGCNAFNKKNPSSTPLGFWKEEDIWEYLKLNKISYCSIYDCGIKRTGCMFCMFGVHLEKQPNRFQLMKKTHPQLYNYCIEKLGIGQVLDYIGVEYK